MSDRARKKALGAFYTPDWLVDDVVKGALQHLRNRFGINDLTAVDPACGDGAFLRGLIRGGLPARQICGVDRDPAPLSAAPPGVRTVVGDALVEQPGIVEQPLDWRAEFPDVMGQGGFHLVIGNPPWRNLDAPMDGDDEAELRRFTQHLRSGNSAVGYYRRMCDLYHLFIIRALQLLRPGGVMAFVVSRSWLEGWYADSLRAHLLAHSTVLRIVDFGDRVIFADTPTPASVILCAKEPAPAGHEIEAHLPGGGVRHFKQSELSSRPWRLRVVSGSSGLRLGDVCDISQGAQTGANGVLAALTASDAGALGPAEGVILRRARGREIDACNLTATNPRFVVWTDDVEWGNLPAQIQAYLQANRSALEARAAFRRGDCEWFRWAWPRHAISGRPKLLCPYRAKSNRFWWDAEGETVGLTDTTALLPRDELPVTPAELASLLCGPDATRRYQELAKPTGGGLYEYFATTLSELRLDL